MTKFFKIIKALVPFLILACILYFAIGGYAFWKDWIKKETYLVWATILGGLASTLGLLSLSQPALSRTDIQEIGLDSIQRLGETAKEIQQLEAQKSSTKLELSSLAKQRCEMEVLVKKAGIEMFLRERCLAIEERVISAIDKDPGLGKSMKEWKINSDKLAALEVEINAHPNAEMLHEILAEARTRRSNARRPRSLLEIYIEAIRVLVGARS